MGRRVVVSALGTRAALWFAGVAAVAAQCETLGNRCICEDESGTEWDMTALAEEAAHTADGPAASAGEWEYSFKFCEDIVPVDTPCANSQITETRAYRVSQGASLQTCQQLGPGAGVSSGMTPVPLQNGLSLRYLWLTRGVTINLICDTTLAGQESEPDRAIGTEQATIDWRTFYVCPAHQNRGLSAGSLFLILSSVAAVVYLCGGVAYNRNKGHSGVENLVPQYERWSQLPELVAEGIWFTRWTLSQSIGVCGCLAPNPKRGGLYEDIDGTCPVDSIHQWLCSSVYGGLNLPVAGRQARNTERTRKAIRRRKRRKQRRRKRARKGLRMMPRRSHSRSRSQRQNLCVLALPIVNACRCSAFTLSG